MHLPKHMHTDKQVNKIMPPVANRTGGDNIKIPGKQFKCHKKKKESETNLRA